MASGNFALKFSAEEIEKLLEHLNEFSDLSAAITKVETLAKQAEASASAASSYATEAASSAATATEAASDASASSKEAEAFAEEAKKLATLFEADGNNYYTMEWSIEGENPVLTLNDWGE